MFQQAILYLAEHWGEFWTALLHHLFLVGMALGIGTVVCLPLGILTARKPAAAVVFINLVTVFRVIPSLAVLFLTIPYLGLSSPAAITALTVLAMPPILLNTDVGFRTIDPGVLEAATGMGMTPFQRLCLVEFPLAFPTVLSGIKTATVEVIASATLAAFIGAGGLGIFISRGFALNNPSILLIGAVSVALLALLAEFGLGWLHHHFMPQLQEPETDEYPVSKTKHIESKTS